MDVVGYTRGRGHLNLSLDGYRPCHNAEEVIAAVGYEPEHDLDNPADSVFCAHGAGFVVPWEQVRSHMHVESGWGKANPPARRCRLRPSAAPWPTAPRWKRTPSCCKNFRADLRAHQAGPAGGVPPDPKDRAPGFQRRAVGDRPRIPAGGRLQHHLCVGRAERPFPKRAWTPPATS